MKHQASGLSTNSRVLVIRKDNIGDLVLTTPLLFSLASYFGAQNVELFTNRYAGAALRNSLPVAKIHLYDKAKHQQGTLAKICSWMRRFITLLALRKQRFDLVVLVDNIGKPKNQSLLKIIRPAYVLAFGEGPLKVSERASCVPWKNSEAGEHEIDRTLRLLSPLGIPTVTRLPRIQAEPDPVIRWRNFLKAARPLGDPASCPVIHVHLSARRPKQRWPAQNYANLIRRLEQLAAQPTVLCTWAPGSSKNSQFPGDDELAETVRKLLRDPKQATFCDARELADLIALISLCDIGFGPDGGVTHLTVGLDKPMITMFGDMPSSQWAPVSAGSVVLQAPTGSVADITVDQALEAIKDCLEARTFH
jgi:heptosyltransferase-3